MLIYIFGFLIALISLASSVGAKRVAKEDPENAYVAICVAAKGEGHAVREWVEFHTCIGVGRIYLYDDRSEPPMVDDIEDYVDSGLVVYEYVDIGKPIQLWAYNDCLTRHRSQHTWLVGMDMDEFIVIRGPPHGAPPGAPPAASLPEVLKPLEKFGSVKMAWVQIGSSDHTSPPEAGVVRSYINCQQKSTPDMALYVKSIANTRHTEAWFTAHEVKHFAGWYAVEAQKAMQVPRQQMEAGHEYSGTLALFHYAIKSLADFQAKMERGGGDGMHRGEAYFNRVNHASNETCYEAAAWGEWCLDDGLKGVDVPDDVAVRLFG